MHLESRLPEPLSQWRKVHHQGERPTTLEVNKFDTGKGYHIMTLDGGKQFSGWEGPHLQTVHEKIGWVADDSVQSTGWTICASPQAAWKGRQIGPWGASVAFVSIVTRTANKYGIRKNRDLRKALHICLQTMAYLPPYLGVCLLLW